MGLHVGSYTAARLRGSGAHQRDGLGDGARPCMMTDGEAWCEPVDFLISWFAAGSLPRQYRTGVLVLVHEVHFHGVVPPVEGVLAAAVPMELHQLQPAAVARHAGPGLHVHLRPPQTSAHLVWLPSSGKAGMQAIAQCHSLGSFDRASLPGQHSSKRRIAGRCEAIAKRPGYDMAPGASLEDDWVSAVRVAWRTCKPWPVLTTRPSTRPYPRISIDASGGPVLAAAAVAAVRHGMSIGDCLWPELHTSGHVSGCCGEPVDGSTTFGRVHDARFPLMHGSSRQSGCGLREGKPSMIPGAPYSKACAPPGQQAQMPETAAAIMPVCNMRRRLIRVAVGCCSLADGSGCRRCDPAASC